ncbi:MAG: GNAT family N-acetyltransferase [Caloramator sp.]|nr:GNAT family N-acetyltransferase [Caloramator sp.]
MNHNYFFKIQENLKLLPITKEHLELIRNWRNNDEIRKCFINQQIITKEQQIIWYEKYLQKDNDIMFIIEYNEKPIGTVALYNIDYTIKRAEFGRIIIGDIHVRGLGIGRRVTNSLCQFGFNVLNLNSIYLSVFKDNIYAINIYKSVGFIIEKDLEEENLYIMKFSKESEKNV